MCNNMAGYNVSLFVFMVYTCEVNICNPNLCFEVKVSLAYGNIHNYVIRQTKSVGKESQQITIIRFLNDKYLL